MRITNYQEYVQERYVATFDVEDIDTEKGKMALCHFRLMPGKRNNYFIAWPSYMVEDQSGLKKFFPYVSFETENKRALDNENYSLLKPLCSLLRQGPIT